LRPKAESAGGACAISPRRRGAAEGAREFFRVEAYLSIGRGATSASGVDVVLEAGVDLDFEAGADFRVLEFVGVAGRREQCPSCAARRRWRERLIHLKARKASQKKGLPVFVHSAYPALEKERKSPRTC
jgi:hypothetical protein